MHLTQRDKNPPSNVFLALFPVALMMASPSKHVSINMEETRPLLEAQVNTATISRNNPNFCKF